MSGDVEPPWVPEVLDFWFREVGEPRWFSANDDIDEQVRRRFLPLHEKIVHRGGRGLCGVRALLAAIVVLDQFSRNMFRDTPRAFAADPIARRLADEVIALGLDAVLAQVERYFVYLPFEHSEDRDVQDIAVRLIEPLGDESWTRYARAHQQLIKRFGRFPHRNAILGRTSTSEEVQFLKEHTGFSQT